MALAVALMPVPALLVWYQARRWPQRSTSLAYRAFNVAIFAALLAFLGVFGSAVTHSPS